MFSLDEDAILYLNGCSLQATHTGLRLNKGMLMIDNTVTMSSQARNHAEAMEFVDGLEVQFMSSALLNVYGFLRCDFGGVV
jgi:hypothetical protein